MNKHKNELIFVLTEIKRAENLLANKGFINKAPEHLIANEKTKLANYLDELKKSNELITNLKEK